MPSAATIPTIQAFVSEDGAAEKLSVVVQVACTEQQLASKDVEDQTRVTVDSRSVPLWLALKAILESYFNFWNQPFVDPAAIAALRESYIKRIDELMDEALENPMEGKAIARVMQLGLNALRTIDVSHSLATRPKNDGATLRIDWALGGMATWPDDHRYAFEQNLPVKFVANQAFYSTEKNSRKDITVKQIANIFCVKEHVIEALEMRALKYIREPFTRGRLKADAAMDFLAGD